MAKNILGAIFGKDEDDDESERGLAGDSASATIDPTSQPRSIPDAWARLAEQSKKMEERLAALDANQKQILEAVTSLNETAKQQLDVLKYLGKFSEAAERRGREMQQQMQGVPDVLRTLPSATREQAEKLSEIAARLYEKARDDTVNALKAAQAAHQRSIEDLIDKSLGASRKLTGMAIVLATVLAAFALWIWVNPK